MLLYVHKEKCWLISAEALCVMMPSAISSVACVDVSASCMCQLPVHSKAMRLPASSRYAMTGFTERLPSYSHCKCTLSNGQQKPSTQLFTHHVQSILKLQPDAGN